ncbi:unnamed protein product [Scytosiphon promiscuus]
MASADPRHGDVLSHGHLFGLKTDVKSNVHFVDEHLVVYPCGHSVVFLHVESPAARCLISGTTSAGITALALTSNRRLLAVAEAALAERGCPTVNIYDAANLKRRKMLSWSDMGSPMIVCVAFSADGRLCLTQGGAPEWKLVLWTAEKAAKVICSAKISSPGANGDPAPAANQADFCPTDPAVVCVTGDKILRFFRVIDAQFKPLPLNLKMELQVYTAHCWLADEQVVVSTEQGDLYLFENLEFRCALATPATDGGSICALAAFSKGFVAGGANGVLRVFERSDDPREFFKCLKTFHIEGNLSSITNLAVSPSEDQLALTTANNQIYSLALSNTDILKEDTMNFERMAGPFPIPTAPTRPGGGTAGIPSSRITGVSVAVWKPLVVTVGMDKALRVWNFQDKSSELISFLDDAPLAVSLHPSGLYLLVSFGEKVRLYSILMEDVRELKEFVVKHCRVVCFSSGGQYFAFAHNAQILVHETFTCNLVASLKGHQGKIRRAFFLASISIVWKERDRRIMTASSEGQVYLWETCTGRRLPDTYQARCALHAASATRDFSRQFCVGDDMQIRELNLVKGSSEAAGVRALVPTDVPFGVLQVADKVKMLFAGIAQPGMPGGVRAYPIDFQEYGCLSLPVSCMVLNHDGSLLFVGGEDGVLAMYCVADDPKAAERKARERDAVEYMEEILVTKTDIKIQSKQMQGLKNAVDELMLNNEYQLRLKDMNYKEKTREITDKFTVEVEMDRRCYEELLDERKNMELTYEERIAQLQDQHSEEKTGLEAQHRNKINAEINRYQAMVQEKEELSRKWDEQNQSLVDAHTEALQKVIEEYDKKVEEEQSQQRELALEKDKMAAAFDNLKNLVEEDADTEAEYVKTKFMVKLAAEKEATLRLKGENGIMKKKFSRLSKQVEDQKEDMTTLQDRQRDLFETIKSLEKDIQGHKKEIREREETIADKEKRIYDLKKKNQELEKFKFVLDYKIKELKRQIEPRENEISDMRNQIEEMDLELEQYHKSNSALDLMIGELRLKVDGMQKELHTQNKRLEEGASFAEHFHNDLRVAVQNIDDNRALKKALVALYKLYNSDTPVASVKRGEDGDVQREYNRQRKHLERNVEALKSTIDKDMRMFHQDRSRLNRENVVLTREINDLRRKAKALSLQQNGVERSKAHSLMGRESLPPVQSLPFLDGPAYGVAHCSSHHDVLFEQGRSKPGGRGRGRGDGETAAIAKDLSRGRRVQQLAGRLSDDAGSAMALTGPQGHPTPPSRIVKHNSVEVLGVGGHSRSNGAGTNSEEDLLEQQQMWREIDMQERQILQLRHHVAQLKDALEAGGLMSQSITSANSVPAEGKVAGGTADPGGSGADGDTP